MTWVPLRRYAPAVSAGMVVMALAAVLLRCRFELEAARELLDVRERVEMLRLDVASQLSRGIGQLVNQPGGDSPGSQWQSWHFKPGSGFADAHGAAPAIAPGALAQALSELRINDLEPQLLGPFATDKSDNALAVVARSRDAQGALYWRGVSIHLSDLMPRARLAGLMSRGYRIQLLDAGRGTALFQSDEGPINSPLVADLRYGAAHLQFRTARRSDWRPPPAFLTSSIIVLLALLFGLSYELRRSRLLRWAADDLQEAETRRKNINGLYGRAIENVAALEAKLDIETLYDAVTGLANRSALIRRIDAGLEAMRHGTGGTLSVLAIGFDNMLPITQSLGTEFASRVLVVAAERVEFVLQSKDVLFRVSEHQLAVILPHAEPGAGEALAGKIIREIESPIALASHNFLLHPRIGIAETASAFEYSESLLDRANSALSAMPADSERRLGVFDSRTAKESVSRLQLETDLMRAIEEDQFVLEYEPMLTAGNAVVAGFEARIRWNHPTEGTIQPARFLPIAAQAGMGNRVNSWIMRAAARQSATWRRAGHPSLFVSFKVPDGASLTAQVAEELADLVSEFRIPGDALLLELSESMLIRDMSGVSRTLQRLAEFDVRACLSRFGTGYSSLSYLRVLPLKSVKIDPTFVVRSVADARDYGFLKSLIDLIGYLGMQSIADGIESQDQHELLSLTACDLYQGKYFSQCMSAVAADRWMNDRGGASARRVTA